jgi:hypothetical protein
MKILSLIPILILAGCVWPGIDNRKQGPLDHREEAKAPEAIHAMPTSPGQSKGSATVGWLPVTWPRSVTYLVGYSLSPSNYIVAGNTSGTSFQVNGLRQNTLYYFSVMTVDSAGFKSPWAKWYHVLIPKQGGGQAPLNPQ